MSYAKKLFFSLLAISTCHSTEVSIGGNYTYMSLRPEGLGSFGGNLGGVQAAAEYKLKDKIYGGATCLWREGALTQSALTRDIFNVETQVRLGYTAGYKDRFLSSLFTGFGWEYIGQKLKGGGSVVDLNYNEVYIPVGTLNQYCFNRFSIGLNGIWMPQIFPTVNIVPEDNARWVTACKLANFLVEIPLKYRFCNDTLNWNIELKPFFEFWQDGQTLAVSSTGIPLGLGSNTYYMGGVQLNFGAQF